MRIAGTNYGHHSWEISLWCMPGQIMAIILERYHRGACRDKLWASFLRDITVVHAGTNYGHHSWEISLWCMPGQIMGIILERYHCGACRDKLWASFLRDITVVLTFKCPCCLFIFTYFVSQTLLTLTVNLLWIFACCRLPVTLFTRERNGYWSLIYFILFYSFYCGNCKNATRLIDPCCQPLKTQFSWIIGIFYKIVLLM
jgi:ribosomal protein S27AE